MLFILLTVHSDMEQFTYKTHGICDRIVIPCIIDVSDYELTSDLTDKTKMVKALWDTGSTVTVLSENLIQHLGLVASDITRVSGWDGVAITTNKYSIDLVLDNLRVDFVNAVRGPLKNVDMIIGMDVIGQGELHITHPEFSTMLQFALE